MPRLQTKIEGRGNGIKTVIPNICAIAASLKRDAVVICKYFGYELGAQSKFQEADGRGIVNGSHSASTLQDRLQDFITLYVLCPTCHLPETDLVSKRGERLYHKCAACGVKVRVKPSSHKLNGFILRKMTPAAGEQPGKDSC